MISSRVEGSDLKDYVVRTSVLNHEQLKAYKSMEAHNYRTSGFIHKPQFKEFGDNVIVREKLNHLHLLPAEPLEPWLLVKKDCTVKHPAEPTNAVTSLSNVIPGAPLKRTRNKW
ncbi:hypothetical protein HPB48_026013 [Haemaphysalis longicornis]|uniref:Uncharacterized protein n=1 Tax=Haemaphysalis longicornis TaxID=44386 RepID=A0A9J6H8G7_HAELO|nr:hypothetical protein HPB48_026013 [Haemaphysalis longicornis]